MHREGIEKTTHQGKGTETIASCCVQYYSVKIVLLLHTVDKLKNQKESSVGIKSIEHGNLFYGAMGHVF